jgi:hypothetical protein
VALQTPGAGTRLLEMQDVPAPLLIRASRSAFWRNRAATAGGIAKFRAALCGRTRPSRESGVNASRKAFSGSSFPWRATTGPAR